ncbi:MAG: hypothetical protein M3540_07105 [Actinomycetota bacterium]|nr:hypothetical protein [Actinomycetota bacterium]
MTIQVLGELVQASSADFPVENDRQKWYKLLPYGEESVVMASGHKFSVDGPGRVTLPADPGAAHVNVEHDRKRPAGKFSAFKDTATALFGRVTYANTTDGNDSLVLASEGLRKGISVELESAVIRAGKLLAGALSNSGLVVSPSFGSASVLAAAADIGEVTADIMAALDKLNSDNDEDPPKDPAAAPDPAKEKEPFVTASTAPGTTATPGIQGSVLAAALGQAAPAGPSPLTVLAAAQAKLSAPGLHSGTVTAAALDEITQGDVFDKVNAPAYAGELWKGRRYAGRYLDLLLEAPMVSQSVIGWRWVDGKTPKVARWSPPSSGAPATMNDIPTNEVKAEQVTHNGFRMAGGNGVDRIHVDLPSVEWWSSYNLESTDDYARKLDAEVIAHITAAANMSNFELPLATTTEERILEGIGAAVEFADPDYILLGWDLFKEMALAKKFDQSVAQASGGDATITLASGKMSTSYLTIQVKAAPRSLVDQNGRVIVGCKAANELQSLPGGPVRVEGMEIQKGRIDHGVFGYHILRDIDKRGVIEVKKAAV